MNATPTPVSYAVWNPPGAIFPIRYLLPLFREIDFFVGDGYRRIPHGGLEVGALLYGHGEPSELTLLAYRPIESQHSFGPSFTLSAFDLEQLRRQITQPLITDAGEELEVVGWLISNCRSDLTLTEQESHIYDEYFPGEHQVTLLAKPEKLKPTRYGFLARPRSGFLLERACRDSFMLPLSTRGEATAVRETSEEAASAISRGPAFAALPGMPTRPVPPFTSVPPPEPGLRTPAAIPPAALAPPAPVPVVDPPEAPTPEASLVPETAPALAAALGEDLMSGQDDAGAEFDLRPIVTRTPLTPLPPPLVEPDVPDHFAPQLVTEQSVPVVSLASAPDVSPKLDPEEPPKPAAVMPQAPDLTVEPAASEAEDSSAPLPLSPLANESPSPAAPAPAGFPVETTENILPSVPERTAERSAENLYPARRSVLMLQSEPRAAESQTQRPIERARELRESRKASSGRQILLGVAILAALAVAALWTYLRLPWPSIPLNAEVHPGQVVVTWPPELTKNAEQCFITTWINGQPTSKVLSTDEQSEGEAIIQTISSDVTIQLSAPQWYKDRTGQIRVIRVIPPPEPVVRVPPRPARRVFAPPEGGNSVPPIVGRPADPVPPKPHQ